MGQSHWLFPVTIQLLRFIFRQIKTDTLYRVTFWMPAEDNHTQELLLLRLHPPSVVIELPSPWRANSLIHLGQKIVYHICHSLSSKATTKGMLPHFNYLVKSFFELFNSFKVTYVSRPKGLNWFCSFNIFLLLLCKANFVSTKMEIITKIKSQANSNCCFYTLNSKIIWCFVSSVLNYPTALCQ